MKSTQVRVDKTERRMYCFVLFSFKATILLGAYYELNYLQSALYASSRFILARNRCSQN